MIPYNKIGLVESGDMSGFYVKILPDPDDTGGYYILYSMDFSDRSAECYDEWRLNELEIENYFNNVTVNWSV